MVNQYFQENQNQNQNKTTNKKVTKTMKRKGRKLN